MTPWSDTSGVAPVLMMSWVTSAVSGHTKVNEFSFVTEAVKAHLCIRKQPLAASFGSATHLGRLWDHSFGKSNTDLRTLSLGQLLW
jgi:hypothetical protein